MYRKRPVIRAIGVGLLLPSIMMGSAQVARSAALQPQQINQLHAIVARGNMLFNRGLYAQAIDEYGKCFAIDPDCSVAKGNIAEAQNKMGIVYFKQKRYDEAAAAWEMSLKLKPNQNSARTNMKVLEATLNQLGLELDSAPVEAPPPAEAAAPEKPEKTADKPGEKSPAKPKPGHFDNVTTDSFGPDGSGRKIRNDKAAKAAAEKEAADNSHINDGDGSHKPMLNAGATAGEGGAPPIMDQAQPHQEGTAKPRVSTSAAAPVGSAPATQVPTTVQSEAPAQSQVSAQVAAPTQEATAAQQVTAAQQATEAAPAASGTPSATAKAPVGDAFDDGGAAKVTSSYPYPGDPQPGETATAAPESIAPAAAQAAPAAALADPAAAQPAAQSSAPPSEPATKPVVLSSPVQQALQNLQIPLPQIQQEVAQPAAQPAAQTQAVAESEPQLYEDKDAGTTIRIMSKPQAPVQEQAPPAMQPLEVVAPAPVKEQAPVVVAEPVVASPIAASTAGSASTATIDESLTALEMKVFGKKQKAMPVLKRLEKLEIGTSGAAAQGTVQERIDALRRAYGL